MNELTFLSQLPSQLLFRCPLPPPWSNCLCKRQFRHHVAPVANNPRHTQWPRQRSCSCAGDHADHLRWHRQRNCKGTAEQPQHCQHRCSWVAYGGRISIRRRDEVEREERIRLTGRSEYETRQTTVQIETLTAALELETEAVSRRMMLESFMIAVVVDVVNF